MRKEMLLYIRMLSVKTEASGALCILHRELKKYNEILKEIGDVSSRQAGRGKPN